MATPYEQLQAMRTLPENWDGYGADSPRGDILSAASEFLRVIQQAPGYTDPYIVPTRIGGVLLAWEHGPHQLEVDFESPQKAAFVYLNRETDESATGVLALSPVNHIPPFAFSAILSSMPALAPT